MVVAQSHTMASAKGVCMATDPVCLTEVDEQEARSRGLYHEIESAVYYFCSEHCKQQFDEHPAAYTVIEEQTRASDEGMPPGSGET